MQAFNPRVRMAATLWLLLGCLLALGILPASAAEPPRAVLILLPGVESELLFRALRNPEFQVLRDGSGLALINASVPGPDTTESAYLTLGAGQRLPFPGDLELTASPLGNQLRTPESDLQRIRTASSRSDAFPGALATLLKEAGLPVHLALSPGYNAVPATPAFLTGMDRWGRSSIIRVPRRGDPSSFPQGLTLLDLPPGTSPHEALTTALKITRILDRDRDLLALVSPDPYPTANGQWMRLSPVMLWGAPYRGQFLRSATTRTPALLSNVDLTPTFLAHFGLDIPRALEGHSAQPAGPANLERLLAFAAFARANREAMIPGLVGWGIVAFLAVVLSFGTLLRAARGGEVRERVVTAAQALLVATASFPSALLLAALVPWKQPESLLVGLAVLTLVLSVLALAARRLGPPLAVPYTLLLGLLLFDLYAPTDMLARNLMSDFTNVGGRFYGIGNEYLGLLLAVALAAPLMLASDVRNANSEMRTGRPPDPNSALTLTLTPTPTREALYRSALWLAVLIAAGHPAMGADFGGALSLALTFLLAGFLLAGRRIKLREVSLAVGIAGLVAVALVGVDLMRPPGARTHVGDLAARALSGGGAAVGEMLFRKALLNLEMARTPYFLIGVGIVAPLFGFCYSRLSPLSVNALRHRPLAWAGIRSVLLGGIITMLLNDTGVIAWALACGAALLWWLDLMLLELRDACGR